VVAGLVASATPPSSEAMSSTRDLAAEPVKVAPLALIRRQIEAGAVAKARRMIESARRYANRRDQAELALLDAEASLAERRIPDALAAYLAVAKEYIGTPQAETALFAAAQVAMQHRGAGSNPADLLSRYLRHYPKGQYAEDARALLVRLQSVQGASH